MSGPHIEKIYYLVLSPNEDRVGTPFHTDSLRSDCEAAWRYWFEKRGKCVPSNLKKSALAAMSMDGARVHVIKVVECGLFNDTGI